MPEVKPLSVAEARLCVESQQRHMRTQDVLIQRAVPILGEHAQGINSTPMRRAARDLLAEMTPERAPLT